MPMHMWWIIKPVAAGLVATLLAGYMFSIALSVSERQTQMLVKLGKSGDHTFDYALGSGDIAWLAIIGSLIALFAGGMTATLLTRSDKIAVANWLMPSVVVAIVAMLAVDGYMLVTWGHSMDMYSHSTIDEYGRPFEPAPFGVILFLMVAADAACLIASASGGVITRIARDAR